MNLETKNLKRIIEDKTFVDVYTDSYDESTYGFIIDFNDTFLVLDSFDDDSKANGIVVFFRENITRIRWGGNEISSVYSLIDTSEKASTSIDIDLSSIQNILKSMNASYGYINVSIQDIDSGICFIGEITEMDDETIVINEYGSKKSLDRTNIMISIRDITKVEAGGQYEKGLVQLFNKN
tara:strand:+ start:12876 stop:13415 length:540 start_codon:yes stop_codon:yes gene_type:complete